MKRYELIEFLKGYSIFTIVIYHLLQKVIHVYPFDSLIIFGGTGVHLFVLLSGFGLYYSFLGKPISYGQFLKRRFSKVYTPYIIVVIISALTSLIIPVFENSWYIFSGHVFLFKMFDNHIDETYGGHFWFISMIIQFYLVFHVFAYWFKKIDWIKFFVLNLFISIGWWLLVYYLGKEDMRVWASFFLQYVWEFALGMVIAKLIYTNKFNVNLKNYWYLIIGVLGCVLYAAMALKGGYAGKLFNDIPALVGYSCLAVFIYNLSIKPINQFFLFTGSISYSFFLVHIFIMETLVQLFSQVSIYYILPITLLLSYFSAFYIDKALAKLYKFLKV